MPQTNKKQGLSSRDIGLIIFVIVAVLAAGGFIYRTWSQDQPQIADVKVQPPGSAAKLQAMKAEKEGRASEGGGEAGQDIPLNNGKPAGSGQ